MSKQEAMVPVSEYDTLHRVFQAAWGMVFYLRKTILPLGLSPWYQFRPGFSIWEPRFVGSLVFLVVVTIAAVVAWRRWKAGLVLWAYYVIVLLPLTHLVKIGRQAAADRYSYVACMGWAVLGGAGLLAAWSLRARRRMSLQAFQALLAAVAIVCIALGALSWQQAQVWRDGLHLWARAVEVSPHLSTPRNNLSQELIGQGRLKEGMKQIRKAVQLDPNSPTARVNLGLAMLRLGRTREALDQFDTALRIEPDCRSAHANLGAVYLSMRRYEDAISHLKQAAALRGAGLDARFNLANAFLLTSRYDKAIEQCKTILTVRPESAVAYTIWGQALTKQGHLEDAEDRFRRALDFEPRSAPARIHLARLLDQQGRHANALALLREGASLSQPPTEVVATLIRVLLRGPDDALRNPKQALAWAERANEQTGKSDPILLEAMAEALLATNQPARAIAILEQAVAVARKQNRPRDVARLTQALQACRAQTGLPH